MSAAREQIQKLYGLLVRVASSLQPALLLGIRVYFGLWPAGIALNGWGKLHNLGRVTQFFASLGLPAPGVTATFVSTFEFIAGILLAVGLFSRVAALGLVIDMLTAYITSDREALSNFFADPAKFYNADPFIYFAVGLLIFVFGPGKFALDYLIQKKYATSAILEG
jgi:putative oxidoreductase